VAKHNVDHNFDPKLTVYKLRKLYKQHGIRLKRIKMRLKWRRVNDVRGMTKDKAVFDALRAAVEEIDTNGEDLIYADECLFNQKHVVKTAWSSKGVNITPKVMLKYEGCVAVVGAISS